MTIKFFFLISLFGFLSSCSSVPIPLSNSLQENRALYPVLWTQKSPEHTLLFFQTYQMAKNQLHSFLQTHKKTKQSKESKESKKPLAIVLDLDETVLDNSPYQAYLIQQNEQFSTETWKEWIKTQDSSLLPGSKEFIEWANQKVAVFFISDRPEEMLEDTWKTLVSKGLKSVSKSQILLRPSQGSFSEKSKQHRRKSIEKTHFLVLLLGDSLLDFVEKFDEMDQINKEFGKRYIIFPNVFYGNWVTDSLGPGPIMGNKISEDQKNFLYWKTLKTFKRKK